MDPNSSAAQILAASEADLPAIAELAGVVWRVCYPGIISTEQIEYMLGKMYSEATLLEEVRLRGVRYERLMLGRELAGFASHGPTDEPKLHKLYKIYLHPAWQGRGLGTLLLRHCEREAGRCGARRLTLTVNKRNAKAIAAYQRNHFAIIDSVIVDIGGGFVMDDYIMAKEIRAS